MVPVLQRARVAGTFWALAAILVGTGLVALQTLEASDRGIATVYADRVVVLKDLKEISEILGHNIPVTAQKTLAQGSSTSTSAQVIDGEFSRAKKTWERYLQTSLVPEEIRLIDILKPHLQALETVTEKLKDNLTQNQLSEATHTLAEFEDAYQPFAQSMASLVNVQLEVTRTEVMHSSDRVRFMRLLAIGSVTLGIALAVVAARGRTRLAAALEASAAALRAESEARRRDAALREMLGAAAEGILFADLEGIIVYANETARQTFGYEPGEILGLKFEALVSPEWRCSGAQATGDPPRTPFFRQMAANKEVRGLRKNGTHFPMEISISVFEDQQGSRTVAFVSDISERKNTENRLATYKQNLQDMSFDATVAEERQRRSLAASLHDNIGQILALAQLRLKAALSVVNDEARKDLTEGIKLIAQAMTDTRELTFELSPPVLYDLGLPSAVAWLGDQLEAQHQFQVTVTNDKHFPKLTDELAAILFRAIRELLTNVIKHAKTPGATVSLQHVDSMLIIVVEDFGVGIKPSALLNYEATKSFGLFSVREQIARLGGTFAATSAAPSGTRITLSVPSKMRDGPTGAE